MLYLQFCSTINTIFLLFFCRSFLHISTSQQHNFLNIEDSMRNHDGVTEALVRDRKKEKFHHVRWTSDHGCQIDLSADLFTCPKIMHRSPQNHRFRKTSPIIKVKTISQLLHAAGYYYLLSQIGLYDITVRARVYKHGVLGPGS